MTDSSLPGPVQAAMNLTLKGGRRATAHARQIAKPIVNVTLREARHAAAHARHASKRTIEGFKDGMHFVGRVREDISNRTINAAKSILRLVRTPVRKYQRQRSEVREQHGWNHTEWQVEREIEIALRGDGPVLIGPWLAEVGYEVLYWVPFLRWVKTAYALDPARVIIVSRGGVESWYRGIGERYVDIFDLLTPDVFAARNAERAELKQTLLSSFDRELADGAARQAGVDPARVQILHPSLMFRLFRLFWSGHRGTGFMDAHTRFSLDVPPLEIDRNRLPDEYLAVKFYTARSLPDTPDLRRHLRWLVSSLSERLPVVLLDTGLAIDDHSDHELLPSSRVVSARDLMTPRNNLGVQTQIVAGASAYVGTCGSLTWLGPRLGVHTAAVLADPEFLNAHLTFAIRQYQRLPGAGAFCPLDLRALDPMTTVLGGPSVVAGGRQAGGREG